VVAVLRKAPDPEDRHPVPPTTRRLLWVVCVLDAMVLVWMIAMGEWLDSTSRITSVITLGGHHLVVLGIALAGFLLLAVLAAITRGFAVASSVQYTAIAVAGVLSVVALAGVMSVIGLVVGAILLAALLFRSLASGRIGVTLRGR
jgi:hypothetical protein